MPDAWYSMSTKRQSPGLVPERNWRSGIQQIIVVVSDLPLSNLSSPYEILKFTWTMRWTCMCMFSVLFQSTSSSSTTTQFFQIKHDAATRLCVCTASLVPFQLGLSWVTGCCTASTTHYTSSSFKVAWTCTPAIIYIRCIRRTKDRHSACRRAFSGPAAWNELPTKLGCTVEINKRAL